MSNLYFAFYTFSPRFSGKIMSELKRTRRKYPCNTVPPARHSGWRRQFWRWFCCCGPFLPRAHAAELKEKNGIRLLSFDTSHILSIGNQTSGKCSLYALRYARTILDGKVCSGSGMWSNGAVWSAAGSHGVRRHPRRVPEKLYNELAAGRPVIVHLKNTTVSGVKRHANRTSTYEYHLTSSGWDAVNYPHIATSSTYGHWVCVAGISPTADPET